MPGIPEIDKLKLPRVNRECSIYHNAGFFIFRPLTLIFACDTTNPCLIMFIFFIALMGDITTVTPAISTAV